MSAPSIRMTISAPFAEIILNRPERRNALSLDMWAQFPDMIANAEADSAVKVIILHGGEAGAFAAGADISEFATAYATADKARASGAIIASALNAVENCTKPTIAAIEGACVGGGVSLSVAADLRVAGEGSKFGITPAKLGIVYPGGDTRRLVDLIGASRSKDLLMTGRIFPVEEAMSLGLINRLVPKGDALDAAKQLGTDIANVSQWSTRAIKRMLTGLESGWTDDGEEATGLFLEGFNNVDYADGAKAFLEKRPAKFTIS